MYQAGEFIVYGTNSVCRVESIGKPPFETEEDKLYYTLVPVTGTETIYIPTDSPVFTRPVISREKAEELINSIPDIEEDHFVCHSVRMANEHYQAALQSHDCEELVQLIKTVYAKSRRHGRRVGCTRYSAQGSSGVYQSEDWQAGKKDGKENCRINGKREAL